MELIKPRKKNPFTVTNSNSYDPFQKIKIKNSTPPFTTVTFLPFLILIERKISFHSWKMNSEQMEISGREDYCDSDRDPYDSDDSQADPNFDILEETRSSFSNLRVKKKNKCRYLFLLLIFNKLIRRCQIWF